MTTTRAGALVISLFVVVSACSVSTPRNQSASVRAAAGRVNPDGTISYDATTGAGSTVDGSAGSPALAGGSAQAATGGDRAATAEQTGTAGVAATSGGDSTGVTADSITVSIVAGFSGPLAALVNKAYEAMQTWQEDVNEAGGIHGRRVILKQVDHKETAAGGVAACKEVQSNGSFFAAVPEGVEANVTAVDCLDAAGIPTVYYAAATNPNWKRAFADLITSAQGGRIMASYVRNHLGGAGKKVGVIYVNQAAYKDVLDTFEPEARNLGLDIASTESVEPNQASFTSQLLKMKNAGVEILVVSATTEAIGIVRDARSMGWNVAITGWGYMFDFVTAAGHELFKGVTGLRPYATVDSASYETYRQHMNNRGRNRDDRTTDLEGFVTYGRALLYGEMLVRAGANPTRESFIAGVETIANYENGIVPPMTYSVDDHVGASAAFPVVCCNSDFTWQSTGPAQEQF